MLGLMRWFELAKYTGLLTDSVESSIKTFTVTQTTFQVFRAPTVFCAQLRK